jgi:hypothetical protein
MALSLHHLDFGVLWTIGISERGSLLGLWISIQMAIDWCSFECMCCFEDSVGLLLHICRHVHDPSSAMHQFLKQQVASAHMVSDVYDVLHVMDILDVRLEYLCASMKATSCYIATPPCF